MFGEMKLLAMSFFKMATNLKIEPMLIHPTKWGYRNNKNKKMSEGKKEM